VNLDKRGRRHTTEHRKVNVHDDCSGLEVCCKEHRFFAIDGLSHDREVFVRLDYLAQKLANVVMVIDQQDLDWVWI
jgi:hypothetical protein